MVLAAGAGLLWVMGVTNPLTASMEKALLKPWTEQSFFPDEAWGPPSQEDTWPQESWKQHRPVAFRLSPSSRRCGGGEASLIFILFIVIIVVSGNPTQVDKFAR